ncbi:MAG: hypothetical protein RL226_2006 [Bacteroidota bacterium]|jgi:predicted Zn-dependent protease
MKAGAFVFLLLVFSFSGCSRKKIEELDRLHEEKHLELMGAELYSIEHYYPLREFHSEMITECMAPDSVPYPELTMCIDSMQAVLFDMQRVRGRFYAQNKEVRERALKNRREARKIDDAYTEQLERRVLLSLDTLQKKEVQLKELESRYQLLCSTYGIRFISHEMYADSLVRRIIQWEDTFKQVNLEIAQLRTELEQRVTDKKSKAFITSYQPISKMELIRKELMGRHTGLNNAHNRYEIARPHEGYHTGPYMARRYDVERTEELFLEMDSLMQRFREERRLFYFTFGN